MAIVAHTHPFVKQIDGPDRAVLNPHDVAAEPAIALGVRDDSRP
jgi:hypothetical protein